MEVFRSALPALVCAVCMLLCACRIRYTDPPRTATEQLLISQSAVEAIGRLDVSPLRGHGVFVDETYLKAVDSAFIAGEIRNRVLKAGGRIVDKKEDADTILEIRAPAVGIDRKDMLLGIPSLLVPVPAVPEAGMSSLALPELALVKNVKQVGITSLALTAYERKTGAMVDSFGPETGKSMRSDWSLLGIITVSRRQNCPK